jgi:tetratricopeptide (TPR) repeat protein
MAVAKVLKLDEYRDRRDHRLGLALAFSNTDAMRAALFEHLNEVATLTGADRVAAVWVDEFSPDVVHPDAVLDLLSDRPRRRFSADPLHKAWEYGIPGTYDQSRDADPSSTTLAIALGSDGARAWFLHADSVAKRPELDGFVRDRVLFLAGEISSIVLHRDLDADARGGYSGTCFPGWRTLKDLEGHESDSERSRVVARRFVVVRLGAMFIDEGLVISEERRAEQTRRARRELAREEHDADRDFAALDAVLAAYEHGDLPTLGSALVTLGEAAERADHHLGALDAYEYAYEVGVAIGDAMLAIDAARKAGRVLRRRAYWQDADRWYGIALKIATAVEDGALVARSLAGLGLVKRELGNLPGARERFTEALDVAETAGDAETLASIHNDLMGLEHVAGDLDQALRHGWKAVNTYASEVGRTRCLAGLAGVLRDSGDCDAAQDAYIVVAHTSDEMYYRLYAYDGLAYIAALRGDRATFELQASRCDRLGWEDGPRSVKAEILYFRGLSFQLLGKDGQARDWLERAVAFADEHDFNRILFKAEAALRALEADAVVVGPDTTNTPPDVRAGLRAMRAELASAGA